MTIDYLSVAKRTFQIELESLIRTKDSLDTSFVQACELLLNARGRIIVTGMGKSGHIGRKIAATLASTGSPAFYVHPGEAGHGDMGMLTQDDVVIAISNSGTTQEIMMLVPLFKRLGLPIIALTGNADSALAQAAAAHLDVSVTSEACPLDLAPTSSTTVTLVMGDALAIALLEARGFGADDFAFSHPSGALGRKLLLKVGDIMHSGDEAPKVLAHTSIKHALLEMTAKGLGITSVVDSSGKLLGVFTDGDLRRLVDTQFNIEQGQIGDVMNTSPSTVVEDQLAAEALKLMEDKKITALLVVDVRGNASGVLHMHDLLRAGVV